MVYASILVARIKGSERQFQGSENTALPTQMRASDIVCENRGGLGVQAHKWKKDNGENH